MLDGFDAGIEQSLSDPLGKRGTEMFQWYFHTKSFCSMHAREGEPQVMWTMCSLTRRWRTSAPSSSAATCSVRCGPWQDNSWKGRWGDNSPYYAPTFVLTHYEREPLVMEGGTTFVTGGFEEALVLAKKAAGSKDVKIGGGVATVRQYLRAGLIDSLHIASVPVLLDQGELLFDGLDLHALGFSITEARLRNTRPILCSRKRRDRASGKGFIVWEQGTMRMRATKH